MELIEAESIGGALHKVNSAESDFPEVATVKHSNVVKCRVIIRTFEGPSKAE